MTYDVTDLARAVAITAHAGQTDKAGQPYIAHPRRVAAAVEDDLGDPQVTAAAWLHDVVEDTEVELGHLGAMGFPPAVTQLVGRLTKRDHESYGEYLARVRYSHAAYVIKRADVLDNADPDRLALLDQETAARLTAKYEGALNALLRGA